jgi:cell division protein FtsA
MNSKDEKLKAPSFAPIVGVTNYVLSLKNKKRLSDIKEDLTKDYSKGGLFSGIWRFITDLI